MAVIEREQTIFKSMVSIPIRAVHGSAQGYVIDAEGVIQFLEILEVIKHDY